MTKDDPQLALFRDPGEALLEALRAIDPDATTPLAALERIKSWKDQYG